MLSEKEAEAQLAEKSKLDISQIPCIIRVRKSLHN